MTTVGLKAEVSGKDTAWSGLNAVAMKKGLEHCEK